MRCASGHGAERTTSHDLDAGPRDLHGVPARRARARLARRHGTTPPGRPRARPRGQRAVLDRLRQRRLVDLLRARASSPSFALGLTPVVFVITGIFFFCTAATYAEATAMYPEAGGSSSFARRAFNEFWSFFAAWAQMLNYIDHGRHLGVLRAALHRRAVLGAAALLARRHHLRRRRDRRARRRSTSSASRSRPGVNILLAVVDFLTQLLLVARRRGARALARHARRQRRASASRRRGSDFLLAIPIGMIAYTGIETISNMAEEAKDATTHDPGRDQPRADRGLRDLLHAPGGRAVRAAGRARPATGEYYTLLGLPEEEGGFAGDPILGVVKQIDLGPLQARGRALRRPARRDDPLHRDQRRAHRRLAARLLDGHPPPAARRAAPAAPALPHAVDRHPRLRRARRS